MSRSIMVVGCGYVGNTIANSLSDYYNVIRIDPKYYKETIAETKHLVECAIVAVPTPTFGNQCDDSIVVQVISELYDIPILLKSTVPPINVGCYTASVAYAPEFLRAETAIADYTAQKHMIIGGDDNQFAYWKNIFYFRNVEFIHTDRQTASMIKYAHNSWLATKVAFFHEMYANAGTMYNHTVLVDALSKFENIGPSHMEVPNSLGKLGYGGMCFPKDTAVYQNMTSSAIMQAVIEENDFLQKF